MSVLSHGIEIASGNRKSGGADLTFCAAAEALEQSSAIDALMQRALDSNAFYAPPALAGSALLKESRPIFTARSHGEDGRLIGFLPVRRTNLSETAFLSVLKAYDNHYVMRSEPLLDRSLALPAMQGLLETLVRNAGSARLFLLSMLDLDGETFRVIAEAARMAGRDFAVIRPYERAALRPGDILQSERLSKAKKLLQKLRTMGEVDVKIGVGGEAASALFEGFLAVEASGWKGAAGTALLSSPDKEAFARRAYDPRHASTRIDALSLNGEVIAANLNLVSEERTYCIKSGYDERFKRFSPGIVLDAMFSEAATSGAYGSVVDSVAAPGHTLERIWPSRLRIGSVLIDIAREPSPRLFQMRVASLSRLLALRDQAKSTWSRMRRN
jgi:CelD/BcsL family acetyltransferase involved in cellulose biosynthesis